MSHRADSHAPGIEVRPIILWRTARWHCECGYVSSTWTLRLFVDDVVASECVVDNVPAMVRIAQQWRHAVLSDPPGSERGEIVLPKQDRRMNRAERRSVPRGGRRATDPGR